MGKEDSTIDDLIEVRKFIWNFSGGEEKVIKSILDYDRRDVSTRESYSDYFAKVIEDSHYPLFKLMAVSKVATAIRPPIENFTNERKEVREAARDILGYFTENNLLSNSFFWKSLGQRGIDILFDLYRWEKVDFTAEEILAEFGETVDERVFDFAYRLIEFSIAWSNTLGHEIDELIKQIGELRERRALSILYRTMEHHLYWFDTIYALLKFEDPEINDRILRSITETLEGNYKTYDSDWSLLIESIFEEMEKIDEEKIKNYIEEQIQLLNDKKRSSTALDILKAIQYPKEPESEIRQIIEEAFSKLNEEERVERAEKKNN